MCDIAGLFTARGPTLQIFVDVIPNLCGIFRDSWLDSNDSCSPNLEIRHVINNIQRIYKNINESSDSGIFLAFDVIWNQLNLKFKLKIALLEVFY